MGTAKYDEELPEGVTVLAADPVERLREIGRAMGREVPHRIIELYLSDAPKRLVELRRAHTAADAQALEKAAHSLRGSSANLGASSLAELCLRLEREPGGSVGDASRLKAVEAEYGRVQAAMRRLLAEFA